MNDAALFYVLHMGTVFDKLCLIACLIITGSVCMSAGQDITH